MTVTSCFVYKVINDLESIYHFCIYTSDLSIRVSKSKVYKLMLYLTLVNKLLHITVTLGCHDSNVRLKVKYYLRKVFVLQHDIIVVY